ncbi:MAG: hypothetical protein ABW277_24860 [Longimicrobiaceae bacterium]
MEHQVRTAAGVFAGTALQAGLKLLHPLVPAWIAADGPSWLGYVSIGVVVMHIGTIYHTLFSRAELDEGTLQALRIIKEAEDNGLPRWQVERMYLELCDMALARAKLKRSTERELKVAENNEN